MSRYSQVAERTHKVGGTNFVVSLILVFNLEMSTGVHTI